MLYREFKGLKISELALGMMRLPILNGDYGQIDLPQTAQMADYALEHGINYFDTAWGYHQGKSELAAGEVLSRHPRESYFLASKFPGYDLPNFERPREIFEEQLKRCRTDYFDFYLLHNIDNVDIGHYLDNERYGHLTNAVRQREAGRIRHLGFSTHASLENMKRFLDQFGTEMEFCQIQFNWYDWSFQEAEQKLKLLREYRLPVWVMEPLRGGRLANLTDEEAEPLRQANPDMPIPAWSFRFIRRFPEIVTILSGMSNFTQLKENVQIFETETRLTDAETDLLFRTAETMSQKTAIPCSGCRYCADHCPAGLDIPKLLNLCSELKLNGSDYLVNAELKLIPADKRPENCLACRSCEDVCPQHIKISEELAEFRAKLGK